MPGIEKELERLSVESGKAVNEIKAEIDALIKEEKYDDAAALAVWKSENSFALGGRTVKDALIRIVGTDRKRQVQIQNEPVDVSGFGGFVKDGDRVIFCSFSLWREAAELAESLNVGELYIGTVKLKDEGDDGVMKASIVKNELNVAPAGAEKDMPSVSDLLQKYGAESVANISDHLGSTGFFSGIVGKTFDTKFGGGIEISDIGGNPVAVFVNGGDYLIGERVVVYGYAKTGKTGISINASGVFKL